MQVVVRIVIILVVIFLIWLLRRWIRRLIFILILLALAFFIYGIFSPSGAARLWYNVRTFPNRVASWISSGKEFLDYDSYKLNLPSISDTIGNKNELDDENELDIEEKTDKDEGFVDSLEIDKKVDNVEDVEASENDDNQVIKMFPRSIKFVEFPELVSDKKSENIGVLSGYSKSDLLGVINKYIEKNLDDDTDILVTVEYEDDSSNPQRIILQTQHKSTGEKHSVAVSGDLLGEIFGETEAKDQSDIDNSLLKKNVNNNPNNQVKNVVSSNQLTQKDQKEAEEIFSLLF